MKVAFLGMGNSAEQYFRTCIRYGSRECFDQLWAVNSLASVYHVDLCWHMDDVRIQEQRVAAGTPDGKWIGEMLRWFKDHPEQPVMTTRKHPDYPGLIEYPLEFVLNATGGPCYFNGTPAYAPALAYASHFPGSPIEPVTEFSIFGCDYSYAPGIWKGEKGRGCMEYWIGRLHEQGKTQVRVPKETWLMDVNRNKPYGYDTIHPKITEENGSCKVVYEELPRDKWPTVEQIEDSYAKV